jgi:hypothetical protein
MNDSAHFIQKVHLEQATGFVEISVYKEYFLGEVDRENKALIIPVIEDEIENPFKHHYN